MSKTELIDVNDKLSMYKKQYKILLGLNYDSAPEQEQVEKLISDLKTVGLDVVNIIEEFLPGKEVDVDLVANTDFYMKMCLWQIRCYTINSRERDKRITEALEHEEGNVPFLKGCFVKGNMALMVHVVTLFLDSEVSFNDLYNAGELALECSANLYDCNISYPFKEYCVLMIIKGILTEIINDYVDEPSDESLQRINVEGIEIDLSVPDIVEIDDPIRMYVKEVGEVALISEEEEIELAKRIEEGDDAAKKRLAEASLGLVVTNAKNYVGRGMTFTDLIQEGNKGLIKAVEKFDYRKGYKFRVYATWWIRYFIKRELSGIIH